MHHNIAALQPFREERPSGDQQQTPVKPVNKDKEAALRDKLLQSVLGMRCGHRWAWDRPLGGGVDMIIVHLTGWGWRARIDDLPFTKWPRGCLNASTPLFPDKPGGVLGQSETVNSKPSQPHV